MPHLAIAAVDGLVELRGLTRTERRGETRAEPGLARYPFWRGVRVRKRDVDGNYIGFFDDNPLQITGPVTPEAALTSLRVCVEFDFANQIAPGT